MSRRIAQHQAGEGANHTKKRLPVKLVYYEEFQRVADAFYREKQVQGWRRAKKEALISREYGELPDLSIAYRDVASSASANEGGDLASSASAIEGSDIVTREIIPSTTVIKPLPEALEGNTKN